MATRRFPSKIDSWLMIVIAAVVLGQVVVVAFAIVETPGASTAIWGVGSVLLVAVLIGSILRYTYYEIGAESLRIVTGPFRWKIALDSITALEPSRSALSSPALSLDRLCIRYGKRRVLVSPADKRGFAKALGFALDGTRLGDKETLS